MRNRVSISRWRAPIQLGQIGREEWELAAQVKVARADV
jgi:hypothetical protein